MEHSVFVSILLAVLVLFFTFWYFRRHKNIQTMTKMLSPPPRPRLRGEARERLDLGSSRQRARTARNKNWDFGTGEGHVYQTKTIRPASARETGVYVATCHYYCEEDQRCVATRYKDQGRGSPAVCEMYDQLIKFQRSALKPPCVGQTCVGLPDDYRDGIWVHKTRNPMY